MNEIIKIGNDNIGGEGVNTINARDLHAALGVGKDFTNWIKAQIERARLSENRDFILLAQKGEQTGRGGHNRVEYHLTLEAGKHVAMMSGTDKGFEVRDYFIECERQAKTFDPMKALNDPAAMRSILLTYTEKVLALEETVKEQAPVVEAYDRIAMADGTNCITDTAKILQIRPTDLFTYLSLNQWIYRRVGGKGWVAYQHRLQQGLLSHKITTIEHTDGRKSIQEQVLVTAKGLAKLAKILCEMAA
ncbi:MAG: phage antirepressor KilAC domain-containing protein [Desulfobulbaceae bacterium]|nr:phage antirepressor KilAC domain-containing protein [Desulfobulbaceae bacterium]